MYNLLLVETSFGYRCFQNGSEHQQGHLEQAAPQDGRLLLHFIML